MPFTKFTSSSGRIPAEPDAASPESRLPTPQKTDSADGVVGVGRVVEFLGGAKFVGVRVGRVGDSFCASTAMEFAAGA